MLRAVSAEHTAEAVREPFQNQRREMVPTCHYKNIIIIILNCITMVVKKASIIKFCNVWTEQIWISLNLKNKLYSLVGPIIMYTMHSHTPSK